MENNEDNRQLTVIAAEIERQKEKLKTLRSKKKVYRDLDHVTKTYIIMETISVLESLLPKEKEQTIKAYKIIPRAKLQYEDGIVVSRECQSEKWFNQTFRHG